MTFTLPCKLGDRVRLHFTCTFHEQGSCLLSARQHLWQEASSNCVGGAVYGRSDTCIGVAHCAHASSCILLQNELLEVGEGHRRDARNATEACWK